MENIDFSFLGTVMTEDKYSPAVVVFWKAPYSEQLFEVQLLVHDPGYLS